MTSFSTTNLAALLNDSSHPCVSIYMPAVVTSPDHHQNPIALRNLLRRAETKLSASGDFDKRFLQPVWNLIDDAEFWRKRKKGLAIFASLDQFQVYWLPIQVSEMVEVEQHYVLRPLLPFLILDLQCLVLAISRNNVRLFKANSHSIVDITPATMPRDIASALNNDQVDRGSQAHSGNRSANGKQSAVFHGQGGRPDTVKVETTQFFRLVDESLRSLGDYRSTPLILAGVDSNTTLYRSVSRHFGLVDEQIHGNVDHLCDHEIHKLASTVIESLSAQRQDAAVAKLSELQGRRATDSLDEILPAVHQGRVDTLFLEGNESYWGKFLPDSGVVHLHEDREKGDEDLLEVAAIETVCRGGTVFALRRDTLPSDSPIAAIYRY